MFVTVISDKILQISTNYCAQLTGFDKTVSSKKQKKIEPHLSDSIL